MRARRRADGFYVGSADTRLRCADGSKVDARVTDRFAISGVVRRAGQRLAANLSGTAEIEGTCGGRAAELVLRWTAERSDLPEPPTASFTSAPDPVSLSADGGVATFVDASFDDLDGGTIVERSWDFGDGASATGAQVTHTYTAIGTFTVTLTVTDDAGLTGTTSDIVSVEP